MKKRREKKNTRSSRSSENAACMWVECKGASMIGEIVNQAIMGNIRRTEYWK